MSTRKQTHSIISSIFVFLNNSHQTFSHHYHQREYCHCLSKSIPTVLNFGDSMLLCEVFEVFMYAFMSLAMQNLLTADIPHVVKHVIEGVQSPDHIYDS